MTTGERIKNRRKELDITADELAHRIGVSRSTVFRYESGYIEKLPINNLEPIARALHTTVDYLMGWDDSASKPRSQENTISLIGRDGTKITKTYSDEQMETIRRLLDAIPSEDVDL